ncbi:hypothetical protein L3X38_045379 [Prunus dulcis]|uniref:Uncharacterized protein n=1 Tax=Prunus dulcis TaxID=3755 RepID=A0AAD4V0R9_PRUDU|nr:hypothetical protein L3X38_045379 [Prunus dulcis]
MSTDIQVAFGLCCLRFMLPSDMMMSTDIQFTYSSVSALDICLTSFGDTRTVSARIADQADYGLLIPARKLRIRLTTVSASQGVSEPQTGRIQETVVSLIRNSWQDSGDRSQPDPQSWHSRSGCPQNS